MGYNNCYFWIPTYGKYIDLQDIFITLHRASQDEYQSIQSCGELYRMYLYYGIYGQNWSLLMYFELTINYLILGWVGIFIWVLKNINYMVFCFGQWNVCIQQHFSLCFHTGIKKFDGNSLRLYHQENIKITFWPLTIT